MRAARKQRSMRGYRYRDSDSEEDIGANSKRRKAGKRDISEESFSEGENGESEQSESKDGKIDLSGKLNLVYDRVENQAQNLITRVKLCLKGSWKFQTEAELEKDKVFLYQKVSPVIDEDLLVAYFMPRPHE
jgi:hypothetical protein